MKIGPLENFLLNSILFYLQLCHEEKPCIRLDLWCCFWATAVPSSWRGNYMWCNNSGNSIQAWGTATDFPGKWRQHRHGNGLLSWKLSTGGCETYEHTWGEAIMLTLAHSRWWSYDGFSWTFLKGMPMYPGDMVAYTLLKYCNYYTLSFLLFNFYGWRPFP